jgi:hypothetical protein
MSTVLRGITLTDVSGERTVFKAEEYAMQVNIAVIRLPNASCRLLGWFTLDPEDGGNSIIRKIGELLPDYTVLYATRY